MSQKKSVKYEQAIARLEEIADKLEDGSLPIDESMTLFEESVELASFCKSELEAMKGKIKLIEEKETANND